MARGDSMERRCFSVDELRVRQGGDSPTLEGHAAVFGQLSNDLGGFREKVAPGAFDDSLDADVRALFNHEPNYILGRTKSGTLRLSTDSVGLKVEIDVPDTQAGNDLMESVARGDIDQMSFGFETVKDSWQEMSAGPDIRTLEKVNLFDVSPVTFPAYPDTDVAVRRHRRYCTGSDCPDRRRAAQDPRRADTAFIPSDLLGSNGPKRKASPGAAARLKAALELELAAGGDTSSKPTRRKRRSSTPGPASLDLRVHEAGHACLAHFLGIPFRTVSARSKGRREKGALTRPDVDHRAEGILAMAGIAAGDVVARAQPTRGERDREQARDIAVADLWPAHRHLHSARRDRREVDQRIRRYRHEARTTLERYYQRPLIALADELRERPVLTEDQCYKIIAANTPLPAGRDVGGRDPLEHERRIAI